MQIRFPGILGNNNRWLEPVLVMFGVFLFAIAVCFLLTTRELPVEENDGVIDLPVEGYASVFFGPYSEMLRESDVELNVQQVSAKTGWQPVSARYISFGKIGDPIWLRAKIRNTTDQTITVRFDTRRVAFEHLSLFLLDEATAQTETILDYSYAAPFSERPVQHRILVADVELGPYESRTAYIRYSGIYNSVLPLRLASPEAFRQANLHELFWSALFYGVFSSVFFLALLSGPLIGARLSLTFGFFLITSLLTLLSVEGYVDQYLVPVKYGPFGHLTDMIYLLNYGSLLLFTKNLFDLRSLAPLLDRLLIIAMIAVIGFSAFHFFIGVEPRPLFAVTSYLARVLCMMLHAIVGIWAVFHRQKGGTVFAMAAVLLTMASTIILFDETFGFPHGGVPFTFRWLITVEATAFAIAIIQNVVEIKRQRDVGVQADLEAAREKLRLTLALQESELAYDKARQKARQYLEQLQSVSHDLLQPLGSLKAAIKNSSPDNSDNPGAVEEAFSYLEALARDSMTVDKQDDDATIEVFPVSVVLDTVVAMFAEQARAKGLDLYVEGSADIAVNAEPILLVRAISNLVGNSVKFTKDGEVVLRCSQTDDATLIEVTDTGIGMSAEEIQRFLTRGEKTESSTGCGLGLAIVQEAASAIGAEFKLTSVVGQGTRALLTIPKKA